MPKSYTHVWESVIDFENIYHAYRAACKGKRYRYESLAFKKDLEVNIINLQNELIWGSYTPEPYRQFFVYEPKKRLIAAPTFRDRIIHHALVQALNPLFENRFVTECFACRVGRGTHAAMRHVEHGTRIARRLWGSYYVLKGDVSKYFPSVDHAVLKSLIRRNIADEKVINLLDIIIRSYESPERDGKGIPIGALTSQLFANIYLNSMDHRLKEKEGVKLYARYMDDFIIIHPDKAYLWELLGGIEIFLRDNFKLTLNPKTGIFPGKQGIDFCGYRIWPTHIKPRKSTVTRAKRRLRKLVTVYRDRPNVLEHARAGLMSFMGYLKHCSGNRTLKSVLKGAAFKTGKTPALPDKEALEPQ